MTPGEHLAQVVTEYRLVIELAAAALRTGRPQEALQALDMAKAPGRMRHSWNATGIEPADALPSSTEAVVEVLCDGCDAVRITLASEWEALLWETEAGSLCTSCVGSSVGRALL